MFKVNLLEIVYRIRLCFYAMRLLKAHDYMLNIATNNVCCKWKWSSGFIASKPLQRRCFVKRRNLMTSSSISIINNDANMDHINSWMWFIWIMLPSTHTIIMSHTVIVIKVLLSSVSSSWCFVYCSLMRYMYRLQADINLWLLNRMILKFDNSIPKRSRFTCTHRNLWRLCLFGTFCAQLRRIRPP